MLVFYCVHAYFNAKEKREKKKRGRKGKKGLVLHPCRTACPRVRCGFGLESNTSLFPGTL